MLPNPGVTFPVTVRPHLQVAMIVMSSPRMIFMGVSCTGRRGPCPG